MNLNIFNPEHDIALAYNTDYLTIPHAVQKLRNDLGFISSFGAEDGEYVMVEDIQFAIKATKPFRNFMPNVLFVEKEDLKETPITSIKPWGWNKFIKSELISSGVHESIMPDDEYIATSRELSSRQQVGHILKEVRKRMDTETCGESIYCASIEEVNKLIDKYGTIVAKAPWSSSGRGIRYITTKENYAERRWVEKIISQQNGIAVEPYYNRIADFAMEFTANKEGRVDFNGLSVFSTIKGKYTGNIIGSEEYKRGVLEKYVSEETLNQLYNTLSDVLSTSLNGKYVGPLGVDMMIVSHPDAKKFIVNPCVEINLRRTMGHIALDITRHMKPEHAHVMIIERDFNYRLKISRIEGDFVNVL